MQLIPNWRDWWRFSSTWFQAAAALVITYLTMVPDALIQVWQYLPADIKSAIPPTYIQLISVVLIVLGLFARIVKQRKLAAAEESARLAAESELRARLADAEARAAALEQPHV